MNEIVTAWSPVTSEKVEILGDFGMRHFPPRNLPLEFLWSQILLVKNKPLLKISNTCHIHHLSMPPPNMVASTGTL